MHKLREQHSRRDTSHHRPGTIRNVNTSAKSRNDVNLRQKIRKLAETSIFSLGLETDRETEVKLEVAIVPRPEMARGIGGRSLSLEDPRLNTNLSDQIPEVDKFLSPPLTVGQTVLHQPLTSKRITKLSKTPENLVEKFQKKQFCPQNAR